MRFSMWPSTHRPWDEILALAQHGSSSPIRHTNPWRAYADLCDEFRDRVADNFTGRARRS
jgi:hypothetical protein